MEADSCSTENIIDEHKFEKVQSVVVEKIFLQPTHTQLYVFAQKEPIPLVACFEAEIKVLALGRKLWPVSLLLGELPSLHPS